MRTPYLSANIIIISLNEIEKNCLVSFRFLLIRFTLITVCTVHTVHTKSRRRNKKNIIKKKEEVILSFTSVSSHFRLLRATNLVSWRNVNSVFVCVGHASSMQRISRLRNDFVVFFFRNKTKII